MRRKTTNGDQAQPETLEHPDTATTKSNDLIEELDSILDEIDDVLEENAEEFVKNYVQKGGE